MIIYIDLHELLRNLGAIYIGTCTILWIYSPAHRSSLKRSITNTHVRVDSNSGAYFASRVIY